MKQLSVTVMSDFFAMQLFTIIDYFLQLVISGLKPMTHDRQNWQTLSANNARNQSCITAKSAEFCQVIF